MNATDADPQLRETRTPRTLQSADEAPRGSLLQPDNLDQPLTLRMPSGRGYHLGYVTNRGMEDRPGWRWHEHDLRGPCTLLADGLTETECRHLSGLSAADAISWCEAMDKAAKPRPQPGDVVSWAEVEDDCLYHDAGDKAFLLRINGQWVWAWDPDAEWAVGFVRSPRGDVGVPKGEAPQAILVARDLGFDPEAWRKAMREWTENGNRPAPKPDRHPWTTPLDLTITIAGKKVTGFAPDTFTVTSEDERREVKRIVDPLRQPGLLSMRGLPESTPERVVELTVERIEADRREIERLRAANLEARRALETPGRQGLRARLAKAEADLAALKAATPNGASWLRVKVRSHEATIADLQARVSQYETALTRCNEADEAMIALARDAASRAGFASFGGTIPAVKAVIGALAERASSAGSLQATCDKLQIEHARSVDVLTAQRDEARRALAEEKLKTTALVKPLRVALGWTWASDATPPEQVIAGAVGRCADLDAWREWARPLWPEGPRNPADGALRSAIGARVMKGIPLPNEEALAALRRALPSNLHDNPSEGRTPSDMVHAAARRLDHLARCANEATARAEKAERNLRAAADLLAA